MGMKLFSVLDYYEFRVAQGVKGDKTSPEEETLEGSEYLDPLTGSVFKDADGHALLLQLEHATPGFQHDESEPDYSYTDIGKIEGFHGLLTKKFLFDKQTPKGMIAANPKGLIGNIKYKPGQPEWEHCFVDMSVFLPEDQTKAREIIIHQLSHDDYVYVKEQGQGRAVQYTPIKGKRAVFAWGIHRDQRVKAHFHFFRHVHGINDKNYEYNPAKGEVVINPVYSDARIITPALSLKDNLVRTLVLEHINNGLRAAHLPVIDSIVMAVNRMQTIEEETAKEIIQTNDREALDALAKQVRQRTEEVDEKREPIPDEKIKDAILQSEISIFDSVLKDKTALAQHLLAKAVKEKNEIDAFEKARTNAIDLYNTRKEKKNIEEILTKTEDSLSAAKDQLEKEEVKSEELSNNIVSLNVELSEQKEQYTNLYQEHQSLGKEFDDLEALFEETKTNHINELKELKERHNLEIMSIDVAHDQELTALRDKHEKEIQLLKQQHTKNLEQQAAELQKQKEDIISRLTKEKDEERKQALKTKEKELKEKHVAEIEIIKSSHSDEIRSINESHAVLISDKDALIETIRTESKSVKDSFDKYKIDANNRTSILEKSLKDKVAEVDKINADIKKSIKSNKLDESKSITIVLKELTTELNKLRKENAALKKPKGKQ